MTKSANFEFKLSQGTLANHFQCHCSCRMVKLGFGRWNFDFMKFGTVSEAPHGRMEFLKVGHLLLGKRQFT